MRIPSPSNTIALVGAVAALMLIIGVLATMAPARRSLRIQASEALGADS